MSEKEKGQPVYQWVADQISADVISGRLKGSERLKIPELSKRYGVSSIPVREALQTLAGEGLVVMKSNRGATVREVDTDFISDIFEIRRVLEQYMVRRFIETSGPADLAYLVECQGRMERCEESGDLEGRRQADVDLHHHISRVVANSEIQLIIRRHSRIILGVLAHLGQTPHRRKEVQKEHRSLLDAITRRDADAAADIISAHFENTRLDIVQLMRRQANEAR